MKRVFSGLFISGASTPTTNSIKSRDWRSKLEFSKCQKRSCRWFSLSHSFPCLYSFAFLWRSCQTSTFNGRHSVFCCIVLFIPSEYIVASLSFLFFLLTFFSSVYSSALYILSFWILLLDTFYTAAIEQRGERLWKTPLASFTLSMFPQSCLHWRTLESPELHWTTLLLWKAACAKCTRSIFKSQASFTTLHHVSFLWPFEEPPQPYIFKSSCSWVRCRIYRVHSKGAWAFACSFPIFSVFCEKKLITRSLIRHSNSKDRHFFLIEKIEIFSKNEFFFF